ncbi:RNA polymerase II-associated protein 3 [Calliphora vicina]|uniref:RNA polymerase II-associated protein 3 n=1 Tax=Calliphora vicina TaxID=7373 RepID=UPI00325B84FF
MDAANKSIELQAQVRQNAEVVNNALNDLYNWEKEIKDKEREIQTQPESNTKDVNLTLPVRSHIKELDLKKSNSTTPSSTVSNGVTSKYDALLSPSSEKHDTPYDPVELKHKEANEIKDLGNKHVKMAEYPMAIEAYTKAIQMYPDDAVYYSNRALCYLKLEKYDECIEDCERAIDIDRLAVKAYYRRMMANESLGNNMDALKDCTTVLMIEPKNTEASRSLERINERLRKNVKSASGPNFSPLRTNLVDILPIDKPAYKRSTKPLSRIAIADVVGPKDSKNYENLTISDEDIDKLFNSNCGHFEEIKPSTNKESNMKLAATNVPKPSKMEEKKKETLPAINKQEDSNKITANEFSSKSERPLPPAPISTAQFYSNWKELTAQQKYQYLKSIPLEQLCKILGAGFDSDTLTDVIRTLHDFYLLQKDANTSATLLEVSKNKQVSILSLLMSNEERKALTEIVNSLKEINSIDTTSAEQIMKNFNLN